MEQNITITPEIKDIVSVQAMNPIPKEFNYLINDIKRAIRSGKKRYLVSSRHLKPEYERVLLDVGIKLEKDV